MKIAATSVHSKILILDFGSQYTQVIARRIRELQVYSEIVRFDIPATEIARLKPKGSPLAVRRGYDQDAPHLDPEIFSLGVQSKNATECNFGGIILRQWNSAPSRICPECRVTHSRLFDGMEQIDIGHGDKVNVLPAGSAAARTENSASPPSKIRKENFALQFHPKSHIPCAGRFRILSIISATARWIDHGFVHRRACARSAAGRRPKVVLSLSGGVDYPLLRFCTGHRRPAYMYFRKQWFAASREKKCATRFGENYVRLKYVDASERFRWLKA